MPSFDDRAALLAAIRGHIGRFQELGLVRPTSLSAPEYLRRLAAEGVLPGETAKALASRYEACRFGRALAAPKGGASELAALEEAVASLANWPEDRRTALAQRWSAGATPPRPAPPPQSAPREQSPSGRASRLRNRSAPETAVDLRKQRAERGPSRLWTLVACALVVWTVVVMAGSLWQRDRILKALVASRWGGAVVSHLREEEESASRDKLRAAYASRAENGPTNLMLLGDQYAKRKKYAEAIQVYHQSLERAKTLPKVEARASNQLARVLVTADDPWYHDVIQALRLAKRAVELRPEESDFLDTLAEVQSRIGAHQEAVANARLARQYAERLGEHRQRYLDQQIERFEAAAAEAPLHTAESSGS